MSIVMLVAATSLEAGIIIKLNKKGDKVWKLKKATDIPLGTVAQSPNGKVTYKRGEMTPILVRSFNILPS